MDRESLKIELIENIMGYFKYQLIVETEEHNEQLPIFNSILNIMLLMNKDKYTYTLKDIDNLLFDRLIIEISDILHLNKI